jgi:hypothetical protein
MQSISQMNKCRQESVVNERIDGCKKTLSIICDLSLVDDERLQLTSFSIGLTEIPGGVMPKHV